MSTPRALIFETIDPNGALPRWITPDVRRLGWQAWPLPGQEAIHLLGPYGWRSLVLQLVRELRPHVLLVHPPYDYLCAGTCAEIRTLGTRLVGLAFDDAIFEPEWQERAWEDMRSRFDVWATTTAHGPTVAAGAKPVRWAMSPECCEPVDHDAPAHDAVMVGRHTPQREAVVNACADAGIEVHAYGTGWRQGPVTRDRMLGLWANAKVVITPNDGHDMVKARLLEVAQVGGTQIVERTRDLADYAPQLATFGTPEECAEALATGDALPEWTTPPRWTERWTELLEGVKLAELPETDGSPALERLLATLAHHAEGRRAMAQAEGFYVEWAQLTDEPSPGALAGLTRLAHGRGDWHTAAILAERAARSWDTPAASADVVAFVSSAGQGAGLGMTGAMDPRIELTALHLHSLAEAGHADEAAAIALTLAPTLRTAAASVLTPDDDPTHVALWRALGLVN